MLTFPEGYTVAFDCDSSGVFQIYYYYNLKVGGTSSDRHLSTDKVQQGSLIDGTLVPINAPKAGSCASTGIKYAVKSGSPAVSLYQNIAVSD